MYEKQPFEVVDGGLTKLSKAIVIALQTQPERDCNTPDAENIYHVRTEMMSWSNEKLLEQLTKEHVWSEENRDRTWAAIEIVRGKTVKSI